MTDMQQLIDAMGEIGRVTRSRYHLTLGQAIKAFEAIEPQRIVVFDFDLLPPTNPHSYRGYYSDLAFEAGTDALGERADMSVSAGEFLTKLRRCLDVTFPGYKGGDFLMGENTPLWQASEGMSGGRAIIGVDASGPLVRLVTKVIE